MLAPSSTMSWLRRNPAAWAGPFHVAAQRIQYDSTKASAPRRQVPQP
ncbi:hypothetical protein ACQPZ2_00775 [Nocardia pseudovaccinii]